MKIFFAGPLTDLPNPELTKTFYEKLSSVAQKLGYEAFWAYQHGTDPLKNPDVTPQEVNRRDIEELSKNDLLIAYVGLPSTGTGIEIEYAHAHNIPVVLMYEQGKKISRMLRGDPSVKKEIVFTSPDDALVQLETYLSSIC